MHVPVSGLTDHLCSVGYIPVIEEPSLDPTVTHSQTVWYMYIAILAWSGFEAVAIKTYGYCAE